MIISKDLLILVRSKHEMKKSISTNKAPLNGGPSPFVSDCMIETKFGMLAIRATGGLISVQDSTIYDEFGAQL